MLTGYEKKSLSCSVVTPTSTTNAVPSITPHTHFLGASGEIEKGDEEVEYTETSPIYTL